MNFRNSRIRTSNSWGSDEIEKFIKLCIKYKVMYQMDEKKSSPAVIFQNVVDDLYKLGYPQKLPFQAQIKLKQLMLQYYDALYVDNDNLGYVPSITNFQYFDLMHEMLKNRSTNFFTLTTNTTATNKTDNDHETSLENKTKFVALKDHNYTNLENLSMDKNLRHSVDQTISHIEFVNVLDGTSVFPEHHKLEPSGGDDDQQEISQVLEIPSKPQSPQQNTSIQSTKNNLRSLKIQKRANEQEIHVTSNKMKKHRKEVYTRLVTELLSKLQTIHGNEQKEFFAKYKILLEKQYKFEMDIQKRDEQRNQSFLKELDQLFESYDSSSDHDSNIEQQQQHHSKDLGYHENLTKKYQLLIEQHTEIERPSVIIPKINFEHKDTIFNIDDMQPSSLIRFKDFIKQTKDIQNNLQQNFVEHENLLFEQQQMLDKHLESERDRKHNLFLQKLKELTGHN